MMQKSKAQFVNVERVIDSGEIYELLVNIDHVMWVNKSTSSIRLSDDFAIDVTEKSLKEVQEYLSRIDVDNVHVEPSMIQLI